MKARISIRAQADLDLIFAYLFAQRGPDAAARFLEHAEEAVAFLTRNPMAGPHPRWATRHSALRFWVISRTNYLIYYLAEQDGVSIERVLDGRRDIARIVEHGKEDTPEGS